MLVSYTCVVPPACRPEVGVRRSSSRSSLGLCLWALEFLGFLSSSVFRSFCAGPRIAIHHSRVAAPPTLLLHAIPASMPPKAAEGKEAPAECPILDEEGDSLETQEQERRIKPRAASTLPIVFSEKINRTKALLECEGDAVDLSGDMGAVGRFTVDHRDNDILLDLKGIIYKTTIVPSNTFLVVNVGQTEAKVEAIMSDFVQLREDAKFNEIETMVEGTLQGFAFDSDEEFERPAVEKAGSPETIKNEEGADDEKVTKKQKLPAKAPKSGKTPAKKAVAGKSKVGGKAKVKVGKKPTAKATKTKGSTGKK